MVNNYDDIDEPNNQTGPQRRFTDFNYLYKPQEPKDTLPNFLTFEITRQVNKIIDTPISSVIMASPDKKVILNRFNDIIGFFLNYSTQLRAIYQKTKNPHLKALIERVIIKNDSYLNSALILYKSERSIYEVKEPQQGLFFLNQGQMPYNYQNYGLQNQKQQ